LPIENSSPQRARDIWMASAIQETGGHNGQ
jgi:hypothetical protein